MHENFKGQDLRGRSFRGRDLSHADFSEALLGSANFSGATLSGAKFCRARFGHSRTMMLVMLFLMKLPLAIIWGVLAGWAAVLFAMAIQAALKLIHVSETLWLIPIDTAFSLWWIGAARLAIRKNRFDYLLWPLTGWIMLVAVSNSTVLALISGAFSVIGTIIVIIVVAGIGSAGNMMAAVIAITFCIVFPFQDKAISNITTTAAAIACMLFFLFLHYVIQRALMLEESQLSLLRRARLAWATLGATRFEGLVGSADFSGADLKNVRFSGCKLRDCTWFGARNLHLAQTKNTVLAPRRVRDLVSSGQCEDHDFADLDLSGIIFAKFNLQGFDFSHANLSHADFSDCDLSGSNLSAVTAVGAKFNRAKLTDACIRNWNIDARTELANIICSRVFLGPGQSDPNPPEGEFQADEFSKLYQQVADTVDFILHSPNELAALIKAVEHLKHHGGNEIYVQTIERKEESAVVKLKAPDGFDRAQIYGEVRQEFAVQLARLETAKEYLTQERDRLLIEKQDAFNAYLDKIAAIPSTVIYTSVNTVHDNRQTIGNISNRDGVVIIGDHNKTSNKINLAVAGQAQLGTLLEQLEQLLKASALPQEERDFALKQVNTMRNEAALGAEPDSGKIRNALNVVQGIVGNLEGLSETGSRIGEVVGQIGDVLGFG